jgi:molybdopterin/thiamine biosynthesis adenylyltransferase/rhodanese-related sulfurtransferase
MDANFEPILRSDEAARYGRHLTLRQIGPEGQRRLKAARVAIVGLGGLGSPAAMYLAAAGVGTLGLIDGDRVDVSNLQRQVLYGDGDVGHGKATVAARRLEQMNANVELRTFPERLTSENALDVLGEFEIVLDGSDNFPTRYLVNDASVLLGRPVVHGSVLRFEGRVSVFGTPDGPCYRCLYPEPPPPGAVEDCSDAGVLGVLPGTVGVLQATEVIKLVCGIGDSLAGRLLIVDGLAARFQSIRVSKRPDCPACGTREIRELIDYDDFCGTREGPFAMLSPREFARKIAAGVQVLDVREPWEWALGHLPNAQLVPLADLDRQLASLDPQRETVVYCHRGSRSAVAATQLRAAGFSRVGHLEGGIDRWSIEVDSSVARY